LETRTVKGPKKKKGNAEQSEGEKNPSEKKSLKKDYWIGEMLRKALGRAANWRKVIKVASTRG